MKSRFKDWWDRVWESFMVFWYRLFWNPEKDYLYRFAREELDLADLLGKGSEYDGEMDRCVLRLMATFCREGHSGFSARLAVDIFSKVAMFKPLTPILDLPGQWIEFKEGGFQHKRCSRVFKENGVAYTIDSYVYEEPDGATFTRADRKPIKFPYVPEEPEIVRVDEQGEIIDRGIAKLIEDQNRLCGLKR